MSEFASAAMLRVLQAGLQREGLDPRLPAATAAAVLRAGARIELDLKRQLVAAAVAQAGLTVLPRLGRGVHDQAHEPTHAALAGARDAADLLARWQRLERYIHSAHRVEIEAVAPRQARLRHVALPGHAPPLPAEDLVVLGVLAALLESLGASSVTVHIGSLPVYPRAEAHALDALAASGATGRWHFHWQGEPGRPPPVAAALPPVTAEGWPPLARRVGERLLADLLNPPPLAALAAGLAMAPRSLQRALAAEGFSTTTLLADARLRASAWQLIHTDTALAEIGFLCGFADQPHFTRAFSQQVGMTPARYRAAFARPARAAQA